MTDHCEGKILRAQLSNLELQISEYQEIVKELTEKLEKYDSKYGQVVFKPGRKIER